MLKMTIDNEEVLSNNDISIKEEILSPSSTILNNVYPKTWEQDKDYVSRFYYPKDYSKLNIQNFSIEPEEAGTTIQINGSATLTDVDTTKESRVLRVLGNTSQVQYTGQNLLPNNAITRTANGITFTKNSDGSITMNGTCTGNVDLYFVGDYDNYSDFGLTTGTYNLNGCTGGSEQTYMLFAVLRRNGNIYYYSSVNASGRVMIVEAGDEFRIFIRVFNGQVLNNITIYPQINAGNTALPYIPYVGGIPSPNPNYPQNIHVVSGDNEINICGKNLFDNVLSSSLQLNRTTITYDNGQIVMNTTGSDAHIGNIVNIGGTWDNTKGQLINVEPNTTYTLSITNNSITKNFITYYDKNKVSLKVDFNVPTQRTFTTPNDTKYISIRLGNGNSVDGGVYKFNVMLEKSSTATTYEPYIGNTYPIYLGVENLAQITATGSYNCTLSDGVFTSISYSGYGNIRPAITQITLPANKTIYYSADIRLKSGTSSGALNNMAIFGTTNTYTTNKLVNPTISSEFQRYIFSITPTIDEPAKGLLIQTNSGSSNAVIEIKNIMISYSYSHDFYEYGTTPIELCKIGTYQDYIYKDNGRWYLHKEIGKVVLNGSERGWGRSGSSSSDVFVGALNLNQYGIGIYSVQGTASSWPVNRFNYGTLGALNKFNVYNPDTTYGYNNIGFGISTDIVNDIDAFKTWVSNNNIVFYYPLATPTNTEITDTTLLEQLESLSS